MQVSRVIDITQQNSNEMALMDWPTDLRFLFDARSDSGKPTVKADEVKDSSVRELRVQFWPVLHIDLKELCNKIY